MTAVIITLAYHTDYAWLFARLFVLQFRQFMRRQASVGPPVTWTWGAQWADLAKKELAI